MGELAAQPRSQAGKREREDEADRRVHGEAVAGPRDALRVGRRPRRAAEHVAGHGHAEVEPHAEEAQPGEDLHPRQASHRLGHRQDVVKDLGDGGAKAGLLGPHALEGG